MVSHQLPLPAGYLHYVPDLRYKQTNKNRDWSRTAQHVLKSTQSQQQHQQRANEPESIQSKIHQPPNHSWRDSVIHYTEIQVQFLFTREEITFRTLGALIKSLGFLSISSHHCHHLPNILNPTNTRRESLRIITSSNWISDRDLATSATHRVAPLAKVNRTIKWYCFAIWWKPGFRRLWRFVGSSDCGSYRYLSSTLATKEIHTAIQQRRRPNEDNDKKVAKPGKNSIQLHLVLNTIQLTTDSVSNLLARPKLRRIVVEWMDGWMASILEGLCGNC